MFRPSLRTRLISTIAAGALGIAGFAVLGPNPASAAPGDAAAVGIDAALDVQLVQGTVDASVAGSLGAVNAPPSASTHLVDAALGSAPASVTASVIDTAASSSPSESSASSAVTGAQVVVPALSTVLGGALVDTGSNVIKATATCPTGGTPDAAVDPIAGVLVAGQAVTVDEDGDAQVLLDLLGVPVGDVSLHLQDTVTTSNTAAAVALELTFAVNVPAVASVTGSVTIARASCESSASTSTVPAATDIDPDHGPTTGGTLVTITGTAFVPDDTSVTIGGITVPAADIDVDPTGTSLTFTTPAHPAGPVDVTVTTHGGTSPALGYTYDPPAVTPAPTATGIVPNQGPTAGGTPVTITGSGFVPGDTSVTIGGTTVPATQVAVTDGTSLTFPTPSHGAGPVDVTVTTPDGTTAPLTYTYVADQTFVNGESENGNAGNGNAENGNTGNGNAGNGNTGNGNAGNGNTENGNAGNGNAGNGDGGNTGSGNGSIRPVSAPSASNRTLARTGSDVVPMVYGGLVLLLAGGAALELRRRLIGRRVV